MLSSKAKYALRAALLLAGEAGSDWTSSVEIAEREVIPKTSSKRSWCSCAISE